MLWVELLSIPVPPQGGHSCRMTNMPIFLLWMSLFHLPALCQHPEYYLELLDWVNPYLLTQSLFCPALTHPITSHFRTEGGFLFL